MTSMTPTKATTTTAAAATSAAAGSAAARKATPLTASRSGTASPFKESYGSRFNRPCDSPAFFDDDDDDSDDANNDVRNSNDTITKHHSDVSKNLFGGITKPIKWTQLKTHYKITDDYSCKRAPVRKLDFTPSGSKSFVLETPLSNSSSSSNMLVEEDSTVTPTATTVARSSGTNTNSSNSSSSRGGLLKLRRVKTMSEATLTLPDDPAAVVRLNSVATPNFDVLQNEILYDEPDGKRHLVPYKVDEKGVLVSVDTVASVVKDFAGKFADRYDSYVILDCRYGYEYAGGHIAGAVNITVPGVVRHVENLLFGEGCPFTQNTLVIVHCEFSSKRGPKVVSLVKALDKMYHPRSYLERPYYAHVYLMEGGYKKFYEKFAGLESECFSPAPRYTGMFTSTDTESYNLCNKAYDEEEKAINDIIRKASELELRGHL